MKNYYFLDLDGTAFASRRQLSHLSLEQLQPAAVGKSGDPICFFTAQHQALLSHLNSRGRIIPVTGRNLDSFSRINLSFNDCGIISFGAVILNPDGSLNTEWDRLQRPSIEHSAKALMKAYEQWKTISDEDKLGLRIHCKSDFGMKTQVVAKSPLGDATAVSQLRQRFEELSDATQWRIHHNHNNFTIMPRCIAKEHAVKYLLENVYPDEPRTLFGLADSNSDASFLSLCDFCVVPTNSQLWSNLEKPCA